MIYLATPYSHPDSSIQELRYEKASELTQILATNSVPCYSPIAFWHPIALRFSLPGDHEFWAIQDLAAMSGCTELWVVTLEGWSTSRGIAAECKQWRETKGAATIFHVSEEQLAFLCDEYKSRAESKRDAAVLAAMKTANAQVGPGNRTDEVRERQGNTISVLVEPDAPFPPL